MCNLDRKLADVFTRQCADNNLHRPRKIKGGANSLGAARAGISIDAAVANSADASEEVRQPRFFSLPPLRLDLQYPPASNLPSCLRPWIMQF